MQEVTRIGVIGDVHTEDALLSVLLQFLTHELPEEFAPLDALLCTGDIATGPGDAAACIDLLTEHNVLTVRGNHDRWLVSAPDKYAYQFPDATLRENLSDLQWSFLTSLPTTREFATPRGPLLLCHGLGDDDMQGIYPGDSQHTLEHIPRLQALVGSGTYRFIVNGHTHQRMVREIYGLTVINAGTLRQDHQPGFLIVDFDRGFVQSYNLNPTDRAITPGKQVPL